MITIDALRDRFARQAAKTLSQDYDDTSLAALARCILAEKVGRDDIPSPFYYPEITSGQSEQMAEEALLLARLWALRPESAPKTLRTIADALLAGWANTHNQVLEESIAVALLGLFARSGGISTNEQNQLGEALREGSKKHLLHQPEKLLRILVIASTKSNKTVIDWAFQTLAAKMRPEQLFFAASCLLACGDLSYAPELKEAAAHSIESAAQTLEIVKKKLRFSDGLGGPHKPYNEQVRLLTAAQIDCIWAKSNLGDNLVETVRNANLWLDHAERQVIEALGKYPQRGFGVDLIVHIYPHVHNWPERTHEINPLDTVSRSV